MRASAGLAAVSAAAASAMMIPTTMSLPEMSGPVKDFAADPASQVLKVDCPGCLFAQRDASDRLTWTQGVPNALVLNISVGAQLETLELNGVRFYPTVVNFAIDNPVPYIPQVPADMSLVEVKDHADELAKNALRLTSWAFQSAGFQTISESGEELHTIHLQLTALERQPISAPNVDITFLKNTEGQLTIMRVETRGQQEVVEKKCNDWPLLCKWREIVSGFKGIRPHFGAFGGKGPCEQGDRTDGKHAWKAGHGNGPRPHGFEHKGEHGFPGFPGFPHGEHKGEHPHGFPGFPGFHHGEHKGEHEGEHEHGFPGFPGFPGFHHGEHKGEHEGEHEHGFPGFHKGDHKGEHMGEHKGHHKGPNGGAPFKQDGKPHGHPHGHMHHSRLHRILHTFGRVMITIFVPILLGIVAGMVTYLVGMIIGAVVAALYTKLRGSRAARYQAIALDDDEDVTPRSSMEKVAYKDEEALEAPPVYAEKE